MSASNASSQKKSPPQTTYFSNGQALSTPPLTARVQSLFDSVINFGGLYLTTLFSMDAWTAAEQSTFNTTRQRARRTGAAPSSSYRSTTNSSGVGSGGGAGGSGGAGSGGPGAGGRRLGRVDDIRAPECGSCG